MPLKTYTTKEDYDEDQRHQIPPMNVGGFDFPAYMVTGTHPWGMRYHYTRPWLSVIEALGLAPGSTVVVLGSGFSWDAEVIASLGHTVVGVETSSYVEDNKDTSYEVDYRAQITGMGYDPDSGAGAALLAEWSALPRTQATILLENLNGNQSQRRVRQALGLSGNTKADWAITANVLPVLSDGEASAVDDNGHQIADNVAHYTPVKSIKYPGRQRPDFNWHTLAEWKALLPNSTLIRTIRPTNKPAWNRLTTEVL